MSKCPNCNSSLVNGICPACGYSANNATEKVEELIKLKKYSEAETALKVTLAKDPNNGIANLLMVRVLTKNFSKKPESEMAVREHAVLGLANASQEERNKIEYKLTHYFNNLEKGGNGVETVFDIAASSSILHESSQGLSDDAFIEGDETVQEKSSGKKPFARRFDKKKILIAGIATAVIVAGVSVGISLGNRNKETELYFDNNTFRSITATYKQELPSISYYYLPTKEGYDFVGYFDSLSDDATMYYDATGTGVRKWDKRDEYYYLNSHWQPKTTLVTLDNGTISNDHIDIAYDSYDLHVNVPFASGYTFRGYYTGQNGTGTKYFDSDGDMVNEWKITAPTKTLYAYWLGDEYTVYIDNQGGSLTTNSIQLRYGEEGNVSVPTRQGYNFCGYYDSTNGSGTKYFDSNGDAVIPWDKERSQTLYAYWEVITTTVTFNNGTGSNQSRIISYGTTSLNVDVPTKSGYTFNGYYTGENGTGTLYFSSYGILLNTWNVTETTITLYADWIEIGTQVYLDTCDGSSTGSVYLFLHQGVNATVTIPTKSGYSFQGYYSSQNGYGTKYFDQNGNSTRAWDRSETSYTLYAYWVSGYSVTFNMNGGSGSNYSKYLSYGYMPSDVTPPTRSGYYFLGFFSTSSSTGGTKYFDEEGHAVTAWDHTGSSYSVYARWSKYKVTNDSTYPFNISGTTYTSTNKINNSTSTLVFEFKSSATFSFYYSVSSESGYDYFICEYYSNASSSSSTQIFKISGSSSSTYKSISVAAGSKVVFKYSKDGSSSSGSDSGQINSVSIY